MTKFSKSSAADVPFISKRRRQNDFLASSLVTWCPISKYTCWFYYLLCAFPTYLKSSSSVIRPALSNLWLLLVISICTVFRHALFPRVSVFGVNIQFRYHQCLSTKKYTISEGSWNGITCICI